MTEHRLIPDSEIPKDDGHTDILPSAKSEVIDHSAKVRQSALWAAYGDALGWISELTDEKGLRRRTKGAGLNRPIEWKRRIGGRSGVTVSLPQGCYSDDSQLRLATGRSIRPEGFDVETFSKVELPVWLSYELGGGRSTKAAATNLSSSRASWFNNDFKGWTNSGGNGAAMRIQPHIWASRFPDDPQTFLTDVVRNAICTHSHPNGLMGAVIHALTLACAMRSGEIPSPKDLTAVIDVTASVPDLIQDDFEVSTYWRSTFERESGSFREAWTLTLAECVGAIQAIAETSNKAGSDRYEAIIDKLKLRDPERIGSGMLTAVAAVGLIWCESKPEQALRIAANAIGTDTDTIATMAGAILGATVDEEPPTEVLDASLFRTEANRLAGIAYGETSQSHPYPDLLHWSAPKARADNLVCLDDNSLYVHGLGHATATSEPIPSPIDNFMWQWVRLDFGQTLIIKRRKNLARQSNDVIRHHLDSMPQSDSVHPVQVDIDIPSSTYSDSDEAISTPIQTKNQSDQPDSSPDLEAMFNYLEDHNYQDRNVGMAMRRVVNTCTPPQIAAFLAVVIDRLQKSAK